MQMKNASRKSDRLLTILLLLLCCSVSAPAAEKYRLTAAGLPDPAGFLYSGSTLATGPQKLLFIYEYSGIQLDAYTLDAHGATGVKQKLFSAPKQGFIADYTQVWAGDHGLLYVLLIDSIADRHTVYVVPFDDSGTPIGKIRQLYSGSNPNIGGSITAALQGDLAMVVFSMGDTPYYADDNTVPRIAYVLSTDRTGKKKGAIAQLPLGFSDDRSLDAHFGKPAWNGKKWLIPAWGIAYRKEYVQGHPSGNFYVPKSRHLAVYTLSGAGGTPLVSRKTLEEVSYPDPTTPDYRAALFIPAAAVAPAVKAEQLSLIVQTADYTPIPGDIEFYHSHWRLLTIGKTGKQVGAAAELAIPAWNHRLPDDPDFHSTEQIDALSEPVVSSDGHIYLAHTRSLTRFRWIESGGMVVGREYRFDSQLNVYLFDRQSGKIGVSVSYRPSTQQQYLGTLLQPFADGVAAVNRAVTYQEDGLGSLDFSVKSFLSLLFQ